MLPALTEGLLEPNLELGVFFINPDVQLACPLESNLQESGADENQRHTNLWPKCERQQDANRQQNKANN